MSLIEITADLIEDTIAVEKDMQNIIAIEPPKTYEYIIYRLKDICKDIKWQYNYNAKHSVIKESDSDFQIMEKMIHKHYATAYEDVLGRLNRLIKENGNEQEI